eukprot:152632-Chlamydomonas_euryale.AAC.8
MVLVEAVSAATRRSGPAGRYSPSQENLLPLLPWSVWRSTSYLISATPANAHAAAVAALTGGCGGTGADEGGVAHRPRGRGNMDAVHRAVCPAA